MQNKDIHINDILNYLSDKMPERERYVFERKMEADPFLMDAVEGYQNMSPSEIKKELLKLHARIGQKKKTRIVPVWMRVAAAVLILIGVGTLWMIDQKKQKTDLVSDTLEIEKNEKSEALVLSMEEDGEEKLIDESKDKVPEVQEVTKGEDIKVVSPVEQPITDKSFAQARGMSQGVAGNSNVNDKKVLRQKDSMWEIDAELEEHPLLGEPKKGAISKVDKSGKVRIRGRSSLVSDTSLAFFKGRVVDEDGLPLPGVSVTHSLLGGVSSQYLADNKVLTDTKGNFEIKAQQSGAVLQLSFVGFKDKIAVATNDSMGDLVLEPDQMALGEVEVVAYGIQKEKKKERETKVAGAGAEMLEQEDSPLTPEPKGGIKKLVRKIERSLSYPELPKKDKIKVSVELFVSSKGTVDKVLAMPQLDAAFLSQLEEKLKAVQWKAPEINGMPIKSSRKINFEFRGER